MRKRLAALCLTLCLPVLTGCFDVEQALKLQKDLSGEAGFSMSVNMEPMVLFMVRMQREMGGQEGEPTAAEIAKAKQEFLASSKKEKSFDPVAQKAEVEKSLPAGVKLLDVAVKEDGLKISASFRFAFDHISKLSQIELQQAKSEGPGQQNPFNNPFSGLKVKDEGGTLLLTTEAVNPVADQKEQAAGMDLSPEMKKQMEDAFKGLRVAFKLDVPFEVVEHNATRREGKTLFWEYDLKSLEKMTPEQLAEGVRVRFKK